MLEVVETLYAAMFGDPEAASRISANPDAALAGHDLTEAERAAVIADAKVLSADVAGFASGSRPALEIRKMYPAVLFFDEADALFGKRSGSRQSPRTNRRPDTER